MGRLIVQQALRFGIVMIGHSYTLYGNYSLYRIHCTSTTVSQWINVKRTVSFYLIQAVNDNEDLASEDDEMRKISGKDLWEGEEIEILYLESE
jgi:hypothetical protein